MRRLPAALALLVAAAGLPPEAWAQKPIPETVRMMEPFRLRIGDWVRAWPAAEGAPATTGAAAAPTAPAAALPAPIEGPILAFSATTLTIAGPDEAALVDLASARRLDVRRRETHYKRDALIGAGLGLVTSFFVVSRELLGHEIGAWERVGWTAAFTAGGAAIGLGVARATRKETWEPVDLITLKPRAADADRPLQLSVSVRF
jgi:hypothetical protein